MQLLIPSLVGVEGEDHAQETEKPQCRIEVKLKSVMVHVYNGSEV